MVAHRYWGVTSLLPTTPTVYAWNHIQILDASGTNLATDPTKASAPVDNFTSQYPPGNAVTGAGGFACYVNSSSTGSATWLYDFGTPVTAITARLSARDNADAAQTPTGFQLVGTDDGTTLEVFNSVTTTAWGSGETRDFPVQAAAVTPTPAPTASTNYLWAIT